MDDRTASSHLEAQLQESSTLTLSPFSIIDGCADALAEIVFSHDINSAYQNDIHTIANTLISAYKQDQDATLGAIHINHSHPYASLHPIYTAILSYVLCDAIQLSNEETISVVCAALTANLAMVDLQEVLHHQTSPLSKAQKNDIHAHPAQSVEILKQWGVEDKIWLDCVLQHHERANGKGYPNSLTGEQTVMGAKIIALSDVYSAMVSPRSYRHPFEAPEALKAVFLERGKQYDETLAILLIKQIGVYPPGCTVILRSRETAIVVRRTKDGVKPKVASLINPSGRKYLKPFYHDTSAPEYAIAEIVELPEELDIDIATIWGYE